MEHHEACSWHSSPLWPPWMLSRSRSTFPDAMEAPLMLPEFTSESVRVSDQVRLVSVSTLTGPLILERVMTTPAARMSTPLVPQLKVLASMVTGAVMVQDPV
jgi:hypothetical protein